MRVKGKNGQIYELEQNPFSSGGEGSVYNILSNRNKVVKIYHSGTVTKELEAKISFMVKNQPNASILNQIAWPVDMVFDQNGKFCGFVMPRLNITTVLSNVYVYPPKYKISFKEKLIIAQNICVVIHEIHKAGYIFGDFNPRNIGVNLDNGSVAFLDTDSYHIVIDKAAGKAYRCNVCASGYAAPELLGKCYDHIAKHPADAKCAYEKAPLDTFTAETDNFALAIHIFKLLNNGFTPFNGVNENATASVAAPGVGDTAIWRDNYCFKKGKRPLAKAVPPLAVHPSYIGDMFTRAFVNGRKNPASRPDAMEWYQSLARYEKEIRVCSRNKLHMYRKGLSSCPWCEADNRFQQALYPNANNGNKNNVIPAAQAASSGAAAVSVTVSRSVNPNAGAAVSGTQVMSINPIKAKEVVSGIFNLTGWLAFIVSIIFVCMPLISNGSIHLNEESIKNIDVIKDAIYTISAVALLCFGSHFNKSPRQGLATGMSIVWGVIFCFAAATAYYVQLGYSAANANATWRFFGVLVGSYVAAIVIGIRLGEWLSNLGTGKLFVKANSRHKFKFYEILVLGLMIGACIVSVPLIINLGLFYRMVSMYNLVSIALWGVQILIFILFSAGNSFGKSTNAWFCSAIITAYTVLVLWLGQIGGIWAVVSWVSLAISTLIVKSYINDVMNTGLSSLNTGFLIIIFTAGAYIDIQVLNFGVYSVGTCAHWWMAAPSLITMIWAAGTTVKESLGY